MTCKIFFDIPHLYYMPQYKPAYEELVRRGADCTFIFYRKQETELIHQVIRKENLPHAWVENEEGALEYYREQKPDWIVFGNGFTKLDTLDPRTKSALLFHGSGTGVKRASLSGSLSEMNVRFVSGPARLPVFREHFPKVDLVTVGFAKLDPLFGENAEQQKLDLTSLGLDVNKKTMLYAPTFYPSSIENMHKRWPEQFSDYNILLKPHDFTLNNKRYRHQLKRLLQWQKYSHVYLADPAQYSLIPFMATADVMVTDTSSAIFEFASLDKPVIVCDFVKLRWTYRGPFRYRLKRRLDDTTKRFQEVADHVDSYKNLKSRVDSHITNPGLMQATRLAYADDIMGVRDGQVSKRIADFLLEGIRP